MIPAFWGKLFSFLGGRTNPESEKKRILRQIAKDISANKHSRFYKPRTALIDPSLGDFFYEMYTALFSVPASIRNAARSDILKEITVEAFLDIKYLDARQRFNADYVAQQAQTLPIPEVSKALQEDLAFLSTAFEGSAAANADKCYNQILALSELASFDFYFLLKKFDPGLAERNSGLAERNSGYKPQFRPVKGEALSDQLKDFLEMSSGVNPDDDWKTALWVLKACKNGLDAVVPDEWNRLLSRLKEIRQSGILELMICHIDQDPGWRLKTKTAAEHIAKSYLENRRLEVQKAIAGCLNSQRNAQARQIAVGVFNDPEIKHLLYYTEEQSDIYTAKNFEGFTYARALNYLAAFLFDIFQKDILPLCETLIIRGKWGSAETSQKMSNCYHDLLDACGRISAFDHSLADEGTNGAPLKAAIGRADRIKADARAIARTLRLVNSQALDLINTSARSFIVIGQNLKNIYEDYPRDFHEFILNWSDLTPITEVPVLRQVLNTYKLIYNFIRLMHILSRQSRWQA